MDYLIILFVCFLPLIIGYIYYQLKVRSYNIYTHEYDGQDQISKYHKVNLYTKRKKRIYRDEYWSKVAENFDSQSKFEKLMEENPFSLLH